MLRTDRSALVIIILSIITLGIYDLYIIHCMAKEANITDSKGNNIGGLLFFIVFSLLTLGIYGIYWNYKICEKFADVARRAQRSPSVTGGSFLVWAILGSFIIIGPIIALAKQIHGWNDANSIYNESNQE